MRLDDYLKPDQAAKFLGMHVGSLNRFRAYGAGPKYLKGNGERGRVWYKVDDLIDWMDRENRVFEGGISPTRKRWQIQGSKSA